MAKTIPVRDCPTKGKSVKGKMVRATLVRGEPASQRTLRVRPPCRLGFAERVARLIGGRTVRVGIYPGTFDPITNGHMDIISRAARSICDRLVVSVAVNAGKGPLFSFDERTAMVREELSHLAAPLNERVEVVGFNGLLMHHAEAVGASLIVRGLRAVSDFEYEFQMTGMNTRLNKDVETVFLMASERHQFIASRLVKEIRQFGGEIGEFVSPRVKAKLDAKLTEDG